MWALVSATSILFEGTWRSPSSVEALNHHNTSVILSLPLSPVLEAEGYLVFKLKRCLPFGFSVPTAETLLGSSLGKTSLDWLQSYTASPLVPPHWLGSCRACLF